MGVLFMMPTWFPPSELWMQRMIDALEPDVALLAALHPEESRWRGRVPAVDVSDTRPRLWRRAARRLGLAVAAMPRRAGANALRTAIGLPAVTQVLVQYLHFAARYEKVWATTGKPLFIHCHGYDTTWDARSHEAPLHPSHPPEYLDAVRRLAGRSTLIAPCQAVAQRLLAAEVDPTRIVVKYLGVPVPAQPPRRERRNAAVTVLYLGRLFDCKGPDLVIRAFDLACQRGLDGRLIMAGDGPLRTTCELLRARSRSADRISLLGAVGGATGERLRAEADIFTAHNCLGPLTRQEEAFGTSIVEAMASALPVVTGRSGGLVEHIAHEQDGIFVEPGDIEAHAAALVTLAMNPDLRERLGLAAWQKVKEKYSLEKERSALRRILGIDGHTSFQECPRDQSRRRDDEGDQRGR